MNTSVLIDIRQLRIGMFIHLDLGWMWHPFPVSSFKITTQAQISTLQSLGLIQVRCDPSKSDPDLLGAMLAVDLPSADLSHDAGQGGVPEDVSTVVRRAALSPIQQQTYSLEQGDRRFSDATRSYQQLVHAAALEPELARASAESLVGDCVSELVSHSDCAIRLLSEGVGACTAQHSVNVMVLSLLLGRALGLTGEGLRDAGVAALLHDIGKSTLQLHLAEPQSALVPADRRRYESHVGESVVQAQRMGLSSSIQLAIAQHHEMLDGTGFPLGVSGESLSRTGQILALVNHYDRMCNPLHGGDALTPHEALSVTFAQHKAKFAPVVLAAFIRMMGVYPPGSVVQLAGGRYAIVVSVSPSRPLRPMVLVHDSRVPKEEAPILDLEAVPELGIRRSLRPSQLPRAALDYLSPRQRICYFFERAVEPQSQGADE